jgi:6-carboxyhexanoate--CoA ligase
MRYSLRMRAAEGGPHESGGRHISGAERLPARGSLEAAAAQMIRRALSHTKGKADFIRLTIEALREEEVLVAPALRIETHKARTHEEGIRLARGCLEEVPVSPAAVDKAFRALSRLSRNMRGAMLLDAETGQRLDRTGRRGLRVSRMDAEDEEAFRAWLAEQGLDTIHVREALILASKVMAAPDIVAELCWSDDPDYVTGYVAVKAVYHRITRLKSPGDPRGGRVFFVRHGGGERELREYLEKKAVLIKCGGFSGGVP